VLLSQREVANSPRDKRSKRAERARGAARRLDDNRRGSSRAEKTPQEIVERGSHGRSVGWGASRRWAEHTLDGGVRPIVERSSQILSSRDGELVSRGNRWPLFCPPAACSSVLLRQCLGALVWRCAVLRYGQSMTGRYLARSLTAAPLAIASASPRPVTYFRL
jgi:hypothetical protein